MLEPDAERERLAARDRVARPRPAAAVGRGPSRLYFQLVNLAEERQRIRVLRTPRPARPRGGADRRLDRATPSPASLPAARAATRVAALVGGLASTRCSPRTRPRPAAGRSWSRCAASDRLLDGSTTR